MKQALFYVENRLAGIGEKIEELKLAGSMVEKEEKAFFNTHNEFRALFHSVDVNLVNDRTDEYNERLDEIEADLDKKFDGFSFRRNFAAFLFLLFVSMGLCFMFLSRADED